MVTGVISLDNAQRLVIRKALKELGLESISNQVERIMLGIAAPREVLDLITHIYQQTRNSFHNQISQLLEKQKEEYFSKAHRISP